ncbi:MAG: hypothetical protein ABEK59_01710 [Halobacteria archaeon]
MEEDTLISDLNEVTGEDVDRNTIATNVLRLLQEIPDENLNEYIYKENSQGEIDKVKDSVLSRI